jgi:hypothetical protein
MTMEKKPLKSHFRIPVLIQYSFLIIVISVLLYVLKNIFIDILSGNFDYWGLSILFLFFSAVLFFLYKDLVLLKFSGDGIQKRYLLFPFVKKNYDWNYFDFFITNNEISSYDTYKSLYLIKNGIVKIRISSYHYKNVKEMFPLIKRNIKYNGQKKLGLFQPLKIYFGIKLNLES